MTPPRIIRPGFSARVAPRARAWFACVIGSISVALPGAEGVVVYETDFDSMSADFSLSGQDGWEHYDGTDSQGVEQYSDEPTNYAWIGYWPPDVAEGAFVYRPVDVDPLAAGRPIVRFRVEFSIAASTNGIHDTFSWTFYNQAGELLGGIDFDTSDGLIYWNDGIDSFTNGDPFALDRWYALDAYVDFERNTWTAYLYDYDADDWIIPFLDENFHSGSSVLNLGDIDADWSTNDPPGDNWMLFDNYSIRMLNRREAWYAENFDVLEDEIAAVNLLDDDADGYSRDEELAFGGDPFVADAAQMALSTSTHTDGPNSHLTISFNRQTSGFLGFSYRVEEAGDLSGTLSWNNVSLTTNEVGATPVDPSWETVEIRGDRRMTGTGSSRRGFLRIGIIPDP